MKLPFVPLSASGCHLRSPFLYQLAFRVGRDGEEVQKRCISQPTEHQRILLQRLGLRQPVVLEQAQMWWKLSYTHIDTKDFIDATAEVRLKERIKGD
jgi:hypothetical protein